MKNSPAEVAVWLRECKPISVEELTELADHFLATHKKANSQSGGTSSQKSGSSNDKLGSKGTSEKASDGKQSGGKPLDTRRCYNCYEYGQISPECFKPKKDREKDTKSGFFSH